MAANRSIAEFNLSKESELAQRKATLAQKYILLKQLQEEAEGNLATLNRSGQSQMSIDTIVALMETQTAVAEEKSEVRLKV